MGTGYIFLLTELYLNHYEAEFIQTFSMTTRKKEYAKFLKFTFQYIDVVR